MEQSRTRQRISQIEERLEAPTARGLAGAVARAVRDGVLPAGTALPPVRTLARELAMSPTTVSAAWAQLGAAGVVRTAGRRGSFIADPRAGLDGRYRKVVEHPVRFALDLSTGVPDERLLPSLRPALHALTTAGTPRSYLEDPVLPELRDVLMGSWPYVPPALTVVDGAMDAMDLLIRALVRFGDRVVVEHPTFPPLLDLLESAGAQAVGVTLDEHGVVAADLAAALAAPVRAVFLQPGAHNPTGIAMTSARAEQLADVLASSEAVVVEDDSSSALAPGSEVSLGRWLPDRVVHIRSYAKSHGPDLRLAAMSGPPGVLGAVGRLRQLGQGWSSRLLQRVLFELLTDPVTVAAVAAAGVEYAGRRAAFVAGLAGRGIEVVGAQGLNVWVPVADESAALTRLAAEGIGVAPGAPFRVLGDGRNHVRVTTGLLDEGHDAVAASVAAAARTPVWRAGSR
ncbi:MAG: PLP-dependent aminotransferase family protein [Marmoricola sp.]